MEAFQGTFKTWEMAFLLQLPQWRTMPADFPGNRKRGHILNRFLPCCSIALSRAAQYPQFAGLIMGFYALLAIGIGAASGAWLRWGLGILLNPVFPTLPLGTLAANLLGGFLMGMTMQFLLEHAVLSPEIRLAITTGFLGGLTTFSTFSAETVTLLLREEYLWTLAIILVHVIGSVTLTLLGILTMKLLTPMGAP